jgi:hypothetical protein
MKLMVDLGILNDFPVQPLPFFPNPCLFDILSLINHAGGLYACNRRES